MITKPKAWRPVVGFESYYEVSDRGQIRSLDRVVQRAHRGPYFQKGRILVPRRDVGSKGGHTHYAAVNLSVAGIAVQRRVHRLVLEAFVGPRPPGMECRHLNGVTTDNRLVNLAWGTREENNADRMQQPGFGRPRGKLTAADIPVIRAGLAAGTPLRAVARLYGVSPGAVNDIVKGRTWSHV